MKRNGETVEYQVTLNIPHLRKKINKTCAKCPVSCVNGEKPSDFGSVKETVYRCMAALGRRACPLRHRLRDATSPKGRGFCIPQSLPSLPKALPLGELSPKVTERARTLTERNRRSDSIALSKRQFIAVRRLSGDGLALSVSLRSPRPGCGSQRLLRCRSHPAGRGPNSSSLFPPLAAVVAVAPKGRASGETVHFAGTAKASPR